MRGVPASAIHNVYRHYMLTVDTGALGWEQYIWDYIARHGMACGSVLHIINPNGDEIERRYI